MSMLRLPLMLTASAFALVGAASASAQEAQTLDEIVITATRQEAQLSKVPISVAAYSAEQMDKQNVRGIEDVARLTPGLTFSRTARGNGNQSNIAIRGIRSETGTATTGIYLDDTAVQARPLSRSGVNPYPRIFDLERVEVLRGPQGTLFGAGSEGGTVRFITPTPSLTSYSAYVRTDASQSLDADPSYELGAAVGGPIVEDKLGFRVSAWGRRDGGWIDRVDYITGRGAESNANGGDAATLRASVLWRPTEALSLTPSIFWQRTRNDDSSFYSPALSKPGDTDFVNAGFLAAPGEDRFTLSALKAEYDFGPVLLVSNTSYFDRRATNAFDSTTLNYFQFTGLVNPVLPLALAGAYVRSDLVDTQETFTQEVRLQNNNADARLNWIVGGYYAHQKQFNSYTDGSPYVDDFVRLNPTYVARFGPNVTVEQAFNGISLVQGVYSLFQYNHIVDKQLAGFGQVDFKITEKLKATAGLRYSDVSYTNNGYSSGVVLSSNGTVTHQKTQGKEWTPKFGLSYQATDDYLYYGTVAKGFRPGSFQGQGATRCAADFEALGLGLSPREIRPDYVWSYELGHKGKYFDRRLSVDASAYLIDWKDIQSNLNLPCGVSTVANLGKARSQGFDLTLQGLVTDHLQVTAAIGYNDGEFTETTYGARSATTGVRGIVRSQGQPLGASPWTVALSGNYDFTIAGLASYMRADYQYAAHDDTALDLAAAAVDPTIPRTPAVHNLDLRWGVKLNGADLSLYVANLTNEHPELARYRDTTRSVIYRSVTTRPRTVGLTATYRY